MKTDGKKLKRDGSNHNHNHNHNHKLTIGRSLDAPNGTEFMDQLTMAATQSGHRLNAYLMRLSTAFHRDLRSTCDTFELLMRHFENDDFGDDDDDNDSCCSAGGGGKANGHADYTRTHKSQSQRILENPDSLGRLHEYLIVVRFLLIQTSASLLTTMDNIVIIKAAADGYKKDKQHEAKLLSKKVF